MQRDHSFLSMAFALLVGAAVVPVPASGQQPEVENARVERAFITDYNLIRKNDDGTRVGIVFVHELYKANPDLDPKTGLQLADRLVDAWNQHYGSNQTDRRREIESDIKSVVKALVDTAGGKVTPQQAHDIAQVTYGTWARHNRQLEHRVAFVHGQAVLDQAPSGWMTQYSVLQRPEAILSALELADHNRKAADVLSVFLKKANRVGVNDLQSEWMRQNPDAALALRQFGLDKKVGRLQEDVGEIRKAMRKLNSEVSVPARKFLERLDNEVAKTQKQRQEELHEQFAPYFAMNQLLMALGRNDGTVQAMGQVVGGGLNLGKLSAGIAIGAISGPAAVIELATMFVGLWSSIGQFISNDPSMAQIIIEEIKRVREDIQALHVDMLMQFVDLQEYLNTFVDGVHLRFDILERQMALAHSDLAELIQANTFATAVLSKRIDLHTGDILRAINVASQRQLQPHLLKRERVELEFASFQDSMDQFLASATKDARDEIEVGPSLRRR